MKKIGDLKGTGEWPNAILWIEEVLSYSPRGCEGKVFRLRNNSIRHTMNIAKELGDVWAYHDKTWKATANIMFYKDFDDIDSLIKYCNKMEKSKVLIGFDAKEFKNNMIIKNL